MQLANSVIAACMAWVMEQADQRSTLSAKDRRRGRGPAATFFGFYCFWILFTGSQLIQMKVSFSSEHPKTVTNSVSAYT